MSTTGVFSGNVAGFYGGVLYSYWYRPLLLGAYRAWEMVVLCTREASAVGWETTWGIWCAVIQVWRKSFTSRFIRCNVLCEMHLASTLAS